MKKFSHEEIEKSLKNETIHQLIHSGVFIQLISEKEKFVNEFEDVNRVYLTEILFSSLIVKPTKEFTEAEIIDDNLIITDLGLSHINLILNYSETEYDNVKFQTNYQKQHLKEDETKAIIYLSLSEYDLSEIKELYNNKKEKILNMYIVKGMSDQGIAKVLEYGIITLDNELTEYGWKSIKSFIDLQERIKKDSEKEEILKMEPQKAKLSQKTEVNLKTNLNNPKKWWEFWK